jgi:hypothetical protein
MYRASVELSDYQGRIGENAIFFHLARTVCPARVAPGQCWAVSIGAYEGISDILFQIGIINWL